MYEQDGVCRRTCSGKYVYRQLINESDTLSYKCLITPCEYYRVDQENSKFFECVDTCEGEWRWFVTESSGDTETGTKVHECLKGMCSKVEKIFQEADSFECVSRCSSGVYSYDELAD